MQSKDRMSLIKSFPKVDFPGLAEHPYPCCPGIESTGFNILMYYVMQTRVYPSTLIQIRQLLETQPSLLNETNTLGWTALMLSCRNSRTNSTEETVRVLLEAGAEVNLKTHLGQTGADVGGSGWHLPQFRQNDPNVNRGGCRC